MLKRTFRVYALSLAGGALLLGGATVAAGAMTLPKSLPGGVAEQAMAAIVTDGDATLRSSKFGGAAAAGVGATAAGAGATAAGAGATAAGAGAAAGGVTGTLMLAAVGNTARRSPRTRNAS
jgi:hypothetical protein